jgi:hypothetical protein
MEASLIDAALDCDVNYIIKLFKTEVIDIDIKCISVPYNAFNNNYILLYNLIVEKLRNLGYGNELLEMMPIIDDYLEIFS